MRFRSGLRAAGVAAFLWAQLFAQQAPPVPRSPGPVFPGFSPLPSPPRPAPAQAAPNPQQPGATTPAQAAAAPSRPPTVYGGLALNNASLTEVIDLLARQLKINYILDPRVKGGVILNTYGETKDIDTRSLLETILRINGFGMVKQGDLYRIVPLSDISHLPVPPESKTEPSSIPQDDQTMLNLVFLKYVTADELVKVLDPFIGENARIYTYAAANLMLILDSRRNMRRMMDLVAMFDSDQIANQRVHVFPVKYGRPTDIAKELENIVKSIALSEKNSPIKFLPIDRINTIIAVAPNPGAFTEVQTWLDKLDIPIKAAAGGIKDYVYRVHYAEASTMACSIQALYGQLSGYGAYGGPQSSIMACMQSSSMNGLGGGGGGGGVFGGGGVYGGGGIGYGGGAGGMYGGGGYGGGAYGGGAYGGGAYGGGAYGGGAYGGGAYGGAGGLGYGSPYNGGYPGAGGAAGGAVNPAAAAAGGDLTGQYLGNAAQAALRGPRVIANPMNNTLLIQATAQEYESIQELIRELDIPPRQVLIEAKIYSIDLTYSFSSDITAALQSLNATGSVASTAGSLMSGLSASGGVSLSGRHAGGQKPPTSGHCDINGIGEPRQGPFRSRRHRHRQYSCVHQRWDHGSHAIQFNRQWNHRRDDPGYFQHQHRNRAQYRGPRDAQWNRDDDHRSEHKRSRGHHQLKLWQQYWIPLFCDQVDKHSSHRAGRGYHRHRRPDPREHHHDPGGNPPVGSNPISRCVVRRPVVRQGAHRVDHVPDTARHLRQQSDD